MASPSWTGSSQQAGAGYGGVVAAAGDVNGDGYGDVIVTAFQYDNGQTDEGRAYAYLGSAVGLSTSPAWVAEIDQSGAHFGASARGAGDVNGDGYDDVIVGADLYQNDQGYEGAAFVYLGSPWGLSTTPAWRAEGDSPNATLGFAVSGAGDVNGDGFDDVIVGAHLDASRAGRAELYLGSPSGPSPVPAWVVFGEQSGEEFGVSVGTAGDVNGDGFDDVIVGANHFSNGQGNEGRAFVYLGSASGLSKAPAWMAESDQAGAQFGFGSVGTAGDVNGDGFSDVIVGALHYSNGESDEGRAYVYLGSSSGLSPVPAWLAEPDQAGAEFGRSAASAGDVNGDGFGDVVVGAVWYDNGEAGEGRAYIYLGSSSGLAATPAWIAEPDLPGAEMGISVGSAGDVDGSGGDEVIAGAYRYEGPQLFGGVAYVYQDFAGPCQDMDGDGYGSPGSTSCPAGGQVDCDDTHPAIHPGALETCNGMDDDCDGPIDEDAAGVDSDADGVHNACDNCRFAYNPAQLDPDLDHIGSACDNCITTPNPDQADLDGDQRGDVCDNCPDTYNSFQDDTDADKVGDACDNCVFDFNPDQPDFDHDGEGDDCDLNDGSILLTLSDPYVVSWQLEEGFAPFNEYRGDLVGLRQAGLYTQDPALFPLAMRNCGLFDPYVLDEPDPGIGQGAFYLVTGMPGGLESSLGTNSSGVERPNAYPCP